MNRVVRDSNSGEALNAKRHTSETGIETGIEEWKPIAEAKETGRLCAQVRFLDADIFGQRSALAGQGNLACLTWPEYALEFDHERAHSQSFGPQRHRHYPVPRAAAARENCIAQPAPFRGPAGVESGPRHVEASQARPPRVSARSP
jgi:hypothetical protein